jgi:glycosyltransferase involved in cell wall biosynthesis
MKRIAILQKYLSPYRVPLFNTIADHPDIELTLVYYGKMEERRKATLFSEKRFSEIHCHTWGFKRDYENNLEFPLSLGRDLGNLKPDVVICAPDLGGLLSLAYSKLHTARYIVWIEATKVTEANISYQKKLLRKLLYSFAWKFIVPGTLSENYVKNFISEARIYFANNSIDEDSFEITEKELTEKFEQDTLQITFSGSLIKRKGIVFLLEGFGNLMRQKPELREKCVLRILGTGPLDLGQYREDNITFAGFCEGKLYRDFMKSSHIFILPSLSDPNPLTVIEALFTGNVVIASAAVGSYPEVVNGNGLVIPSGSADEVCKALDDITVLPRGHLAAMAGQSLSLSKNFTTARSADGFLSAILG